MTLYPHQMRTVLAYIDALNEAEKAICSSDDYDTDITLRIEFRLDGETIGHLVDETGGTWSFTDRDPSS